jgi:hypothetical protein
VTDVIVGAPGTVALAAPADPPLSAATITTPHNQARRPDLRDRELDVPITILIARPIDPRRRRKRSRSPSRPRTVRDDRLRALADWITVSPLSKTTHHHNNNLTAG